MEGATSFAGKLQLGSHHTAPFMAEASSGMRPVPYWRPAVMLPCTSWA